MLFLRVFMPVAGCAQSHKDEGQEGKDKRLDEADKDLEEVEGNGTHKRQQKIDDEQEHIASEHVAEKTEAERKDPQRVQYQFQNTHDQNHGTFFEGEVAPHLQTPAQYLEAVDLCGDNRNDRQRDRKVEI